VASATDDAANMAAALALARRGLGNTWPNPSVGCVIVGDGRIVGRGWTGAGGRPHAETEALDRAGPAARKATALVTLEPCDHHGQTPPCSEALVAAGVDRVVVAVEDPDPRVAGRGIDRLRAAGIDVDVGLGADEAKDINAGFFQRVLHGRPLFTLKAAVTLDGRIAAASKASRWITGPAAREEAHRLRAMHDAVLVGSETVLADDPALTCRLPGLTDRSPVRVVLDGKLRTPPTATLVADAAHHPTWVMTTGSAPATARQALTDRGVEVIDVEADAEGRPAAPAVAAVLGDRGITRVLVEGGGTVAASLLAAGLVDRVAWFVAPRFLGGDGWPAIGPLGLSTPNEGPAFGDARMRALDGDTLILLRRSE